MLSKSYDTFLGESRFFIRFMLMVVFGLAAGIVQGHEVPVVAFPGAEGFGAGSVGGRGGAVIEVTNLNDSGPGSLRAAIEADGARTVVFKIGGTITLVNQLTISNPYITIAGQTAPGHGVTLRNDPSLTRTPLVIATHHVIIRYIRVRPGSSVELSCCLDAIYIATGANNIIVDHVSASWATDGILDIGDADDVTIQWSIISEGLRQSTHDEGSHSTGMLIDTTGKVSVHHNLYVHNKERNPRVGGANPLDFVNNVIYNSVSSPTVITSIKKPSYVNYIKNYLKVGPSTTEEQIFPVAFTGENEFERAIFVLGNYFDGRSYVNGANESAVRPSNREFIVDDPFPAPSITVTSATDAYEAVLANAGAVIPHRDAVDERLVKQVINSTGSTIDDPDEVGGWPVLELGLGYLDSDHDGMSDDYERTQGLDPKNAADGIEDRNNNGYTNLEEFLNDLAS